MQATLTVNGDPGPLGSHSTGRRRDGSTYIRSASKRGEAWRDLVAAEALVHRANVLKARTLPPPYNITCVFFELAPASPKHPWPTREDLDKLLRATYDGLTQGRLIEDDRHVIGGQQSLTFCKDYPRALITVTSHADKYPGAAR